MATYSGPTNAKGKGKAKASSIHKKPGRRADKTFAGTKTTKKASKKKESVKRPAGAAMPAKWINTGTYEIVVPEPVITYLTTLAAHQAVKNMDLLLGTVEALLREGSRELAFTDDSLISIVQRCQRATFVSSAMDFLYMVQYLQLVFKVSRYVLKVLGDHHFPASVTEGMFSAYSVRTPSSPL